MDEFEIEALFIRREAVLTQGRLMGWDGLDMLMEILIPHESVLAASIERAHQTGPSPLAVKVARGKQKRPPRLPKALVERRKARGPTLDEILAGLVKK